MTDKSLDFDLVTLVNCQPNDSTIRRLKDENGLPEKIEGQMTSPAGVNLATKVDKAGIGNKKIDFCLAISHNDYLKKFKGTLFELMS